MKTKYLILIIAGVLLVGIVAGATAIKDKSKKFEKDGDNVLIYKLTNIINVKDSKKQIKDLEKNITDKEKELEDLAPQLENCIIYENELDVDCQDRFDIEYGRIWKEIQDYKQQLSDLEEANAKV